MIIIRYLVRETFKSQIAILFILLLIFFCQKLVKILSAAVEGDIPVTVIFSLLGLGVPEMAQLILPLSLFLAILMTYGKLYADSEITAMQACGAGKKILLSSALLLSLITCGLAAANTLWLGPWSSQYQDLVLANAKANPSLAALVEGQFHPTADGNTVLFVGDVKNNKFNHVFLARTQPSENQRPSVIVADSGHVTRAKDGSQTVHLNQGTRYEGTAMLRDFRVTSFSNYQALIGLQETNVESTDNEQKSLAQLFAENSYEAWAEINWRLVLIISVPLMALLVIPLSVVNPRQGRVASMLPAMLLYLIYFLLQSSLKSNADKGHINTMFWVWLVNFSYFALAIALNLWDSIPVRRLRARFKGIA